LSCTELRDFGKQEMVSSLFAQELMTFKELKISKIEKNDFKIFVFISK